MKITLPDIIQVRQFWSTLKYLHLEGIFVGERELMIFLEAHAGTLKRLELVDMSLYSNFPLGHGIESDLSWISLMKPMRRRLQLDHISFSGSLIDNLEKWVVRKDQEPCKSGIGERHTDCLKARIENFITDGGDHSSESSEKADPFQEAKEVGNFDWCWYGIIRI